MLTFQSRRVLYAFVLVHQERACIENGYSVLRSRACDCILRTAGSWHFCGLGWCKVSITYCYHLNKQLNARLQAQQSANSCERGLAGWQWLFIIEGAASFALGLIAIPLLPDFPHSKTGAGMWLFNEEERQLAMERIERDRVSDKESDHSIMYGLKLAAKDYRVWVFVSRRHIPGISTQYINTNYPNSRSCSPPTIPPMLSIISTRQSSEDLT
jgi:hypothetical protein